MRQRQSRGEGGEGGGAASRTAPQGTGRAGGRAVTRMYRRGGRGWGGGRPAGDCASAPGCQRSAHAPASTPSVLGRGGGAKERRAGRREASGSLLKGAAGQPGRGRPSSRSSPRLPRQLIKATRVTLRIAAEATCVIFDFFFLRPDSGIFKCLL